MIDKRVRIGFAKLLTLLFITLRLLGEIDWSWWCVLSPIAISIILRSIVLTVVERISKGTDFCKHFIARGN